MGMSKSAVEVIRASGVAFGTSGARGLVTAFSDEVCIAFTTAFIDSMRERFDFDRVAIAIDRRPSSPHMAAACCAALRALGYNVDYYGVVPTPALALKAMADGVPAIMVTGSHIPFDRNGIKFYRPDGEITKADEQAIMQSAAALPASGEIRPESQSDGARQHYAERYTGWFSGRPLAGKRVGLYQHSAAGRDLNVEVLEALGAEVVALGRSEEFVPVDTEAVSAEDRARGLHWVVEYQLDALLTTDGDGDRPLLANERGEWLRGDIVGLLTARELGVQALAVPVSCNTAIETSGVFDSVQRTRIGSPYVLEKMAQLVEQHDRVAGFEANGGFMLGTVIEAEGRRLEPLPTRDALLPALTLMVAAARQGHPVSMLVDGLPQRFTASDRRQGITAETSGVLLAKWLSVPANMQADLHLIADPVEVDTTDGLRVTLTNGDIVHLRPSGNAPELRCYVESDTAEKADKLLLECMQELNKI